MKRFFAVFFSVLIGLTAQAQMGAGFGGGQAGSNLVGKITAVIVDSLTGKPIEYAAVSVSKSGSDKSLNGAVADEKGVVKLENLKPDSYRVTITSIGYTTKIIDPVVLTPAKPDARLGKVNFAPNPKLLNSITVEAQAAVIENKIDKLVYNADKDVTSTGGDAGDVLRKVPMVTVDNDGNVALRGSQNIRILINGKPSSLMAGSVADAIKMIPADQIKSVEVITNPSAKYDGEGSAGILNIITKKKDVEGQNGTVTLTTGTRQNMAMASVNWRRGRLGLNANFGSNWAWKRSSDTYFFRSDSTTDHVRTLTQTGRSDVKRGGGRGQFGMDYDINKYNNISSNFSYFFFQFDREGTLNSSLSDVTDYNYRRTYFTGNGRLGFDWSTDYKRTFQKKDRELTAAFLWSQSRDHNKSSYEIDVPVSSQQGSSLGSNRELTSQLDFIEPLGKAMKMETGLKNITRTISSDYRSATADSTSVLMVDLSRTNVFQYTQVVYAGYLNLSATFAKNYTISAGSRVEQTAIQGSFASTYAAFSNSYTNLLPNMTISRSFKKAKTVKLSYNRRIQRPGLNFLNPYTENSDPRNITMGNPKLRPELTDQLEIGYSSFWKGTVINASVFYRHSQDVIESVLSVDTNGVSTTMFRNNSVINSYGSNIFGSISPINKLTIRGNVNAYYDFIQGLYSTQTNKGILYSANMSVTYNLPKGLVVEGFGFFNSPRRTLQGTNPSFSMMNFGLKKELFKKKGSIGLNITNPFKRDNVFASKLSGNDFYQESKVAVPFRSFGISFSWSFGKMEFNQPRGKKKGINNDDLKQGDSQQGM